MDGHAKAMKHMQLYNNGSNAPYVNRDRKSRRNERSNTAKSWLRNILLVARCQLPVVSCQLPVLDRLRAREEFVNRKL